ncbi:helix-turn-helix transcriptional regulator [Sediminibacillus massiliensis]|uniref:helix-turn-helix transcriptional regulator n=1 Tax=Sediminibacillus massiliensis TaxID=1926277 RepID=UPI001177D684|nr:hypothetical protein [Sediminibacillus massiliensis]
MKKKVRSKLGEVLESKGIRKKWVADNIGATQAQVNRWCNNDKDGVAESTPSVYYILRLEKLLDVKVSDMYEETTEE